MYEVSWDLPTKTPKFFLYREEEEETNNISQDIDQCVWSVKNGGKVKMPKIEIEKGIYVLYL